MGNLNCNGEIKLNDQNILSKAYPIGSIYLTKDSTSPASFFGGDWEMLPAGYALWTASSGAMELITAGLPEMVGRVHGLWGGTTFDHGPESSGAAILGSQIAEGSAAGSGWHTYLQDVQIKASRSNPIYGSSSTVQPPAVKIYAWRRVS